MWPSQVTPSYRKRWWEKSISMFCESAEGLQLKAFLDPNNLKPSLEDFIVRDLVGEWMPGGANSTAVTFIGWPTNQTLGTTTGRANATTNNYTKRDKVGFVSSSTAGNFAGLHTSNLGIAMGGNAAGGFTKIVRFGCSDAATVAGARQFCGVSQITTPSNAEPSSLTVAIGVGHGASDTNLKIYYGGSVAQTPIDLGASFPANTLSLDPYELALFSFSETALKIGYQVRHLLTGAVARGILTAATAGVQLPAAGTQLVNDKNWRCNNATALAVGLDLFGMMRGIKDEGAV